MLSAMIYMTHMSCDALETRRVSLSRAFDYVFVSAVDPRRGQGNPAPT